MKTEKYTHTPGPWIQDGPHVYNQHANICSVSEPRASQTVGYTQIQRGSKDAGEAWANARLIAASPDLLEACEAALEVVNDCDPDTVRMYAPILRAAIAKATNNAEKK